MRLDRVVCMSNSGTPSVPAYHVLLSAAKFQLFKGSWNKRNVALKVMLDHGVAPSSTVR